MLTYGCEVRALEKSNKKIITATEMKFIRKTAGVRCKIRSKVITSNLGVTPVMKKINMPQEIEKSSCRKMDETRLPKKV